MIKKTLIYMSIILLLTAIIPLYVQAEDFILPDLRLEINNQSEGDNQGQDLVLSLRILLLLTVLSLAPAILVMVTSFTRIIIVLSLIRTALATRQMPPNQVLIGLAIFITIFIMAPVWQQVNTDAIQPYIEEEINTETMYQRGITPIREFMFRQTRENDLALFVDMADIDRPNNRDGVPTYILIPAFVISELKTAFQIGFMIYIPFLMIDMIVASTLMSMGMMMLPPVMISIPFKILLFVLVDGWSLVIKSLINTFH